MQGKMSLYAINNMALNIMAINNMDIKNMAIINMAIDNIFTTNPETNMSRKMYSMYSGKPRSRNRNGSMWI